MKSKSKSFSDIQQILAQKGSKCICFNIYGTVTGANLDKNCGDYCKKLAPNIQRAILTGLVKKEHKQEIEKIDEARRQLESNCTDLSQNDIAGLTPIRKHQVSDDDKRFLINANWWHEWCNYTGFNEAQLFDANCDSQETEEDDFQSEQLYNKPGPIKNKTLLLNEASAMASCGNSGQLK